MDDVDVLWMCGGQNVDDVNFHRHARADASDNRKDLMLWESRLYGNTSLTHVRVQVDENSRYL